jgi:branched-chain amino acid aminotransferase
MAQSRRAGATQDGIKTPASTWVAYWNGRFVPDQEVRISPWDRGFIMADSAYEATRTFRHVPFHLDWHLDRLFNTLAYMRLDPRLSRAELEAITLEVQERNRGNLRPHDDVVFTHRVTRGEFGGSFASSEGPPTVLIGCRPIGFARFARYYNEGLQVEIPSIRVPVAGGIDPRIKTHNRLMLTLGHVQVGHLRPDVVPLVLDVEGYVTESSAANIHYVVDGGLVTPPDEAGLEGITRRVVLSLNEQLGIAVTRRRIHRDELASVQEAMVTATSFSVLPVCRLDGRPLSPVPGPVTAKLIAAFSGYAGVDIVEQSRLNAANA